MHRSLVVSHQSSVKRRSSAARGGFSFTEILFAVMILGIGFIMVAAMFPVAIKQTELTGQENTAANIGSAGVSNFEQMAVQLASPIPTVRDGLLLSGLSPTLAATAPPGPVLIHSPVWTFHDPRFIGANDSHNGLAIRDELWTAICGNLINATDTRYAWVPMYRRDVFIDANNRQSFSSMIQLILIGVQARNQPTYTVGRDLTPLPLKDPLAAATLEAHLTTAKVIGPNVGTGEPTGLIQFMPNISPGDTQFDTGSGNLTGRIAEGTYVVISDDGIPYNSAPAGTINNPGVFNGWILKIGAFRSDLTAKHPSQPTYELVNGYDLPAVQTLDQAQVIVVGRGLHDPTDKTRGFDGVAQDISVFTTYVRVQ